MKRLLGFVAGLAALGGGVLWWRRHPRAGAAWVNRVANPWLVRVGIAGRTRGEIGLLEHVGRRSRIVRVTPVHPVATAEGFRIIVPLGSQSQWARNVLAAGHCRLQVGEEIHELDEPRLISPGLVEGMPAVMGRVMDWLGFRYLALRRFASESGTLDVMGLNETVEPVEAIGTTPVPVPA
jgi:deazaflavin-dependent oxidoreductase (nitroreductase family)